MGTRYKVIAFIDEDKNKTGKKLEGVDISRMEKLDTLLKDNVVDNLIISPAPNARKKTSYCRCMPAFSNEGFYCASGIKLD